MTGDRQALFVRSVKALKARIRAGVSVVVR